MIASALALAAAIAVSGGLFARRALLLTRLVRMGTRSGIERWDDVPERLRAGGGRRARPAQAAAAADARG